MRDEVIDRLNVAAADGLRDHLRRLGFGLCQALARFSVAKRRLAPAFGFQDCTLLFALGAQNLGLPVAFGVQNIRALFAFCFHLPRHGVDQIARWRNVLDLDASDLDAPGRCRVIDDQQQPLVDGVAFGQQFIEIHRAHDGTNIGHGQINDGVLEVADLVGGLRRIEYLVKHHARRPRPWRCRG